MTSKIRNCVTHHHACDCREEKFRLIEKQLLEAEKVIAFYSNQWTSWEGIYGEKIIPQDREEIEKHRCSGGKRAREYFKNKVNL